MGKKLSRGRVMEHVTGIEPVFPAWEASVIADIRHVQKINDDGARDGNRTRIRNLEGSGNSHYTTRAVSVRCRLYTHLVFPSVF